MANAWIMPELLKWIWRRMFPPDPLQNERLSIELGGSMFRRQNVDRYLEALRSGKMKTRADRGQGVIDTTDETIARLEKLKIRLERDFDG